METIINFILQVMQEFNITEFHFKQSIVKPGYYLKFIKEWLRLSGNHILNSRGGYFTVWKITDTTAREYFTPKIYYIW